jgi:hypothetical protein
MKRSESSPKKESSLTPGLYFHSSTLTGNADRAVNITNDGVYLTEKTRMKMVELSSQAEPPVSRGNRLSSRSFADNDIDERRRRSYARFEELNKKYHEDYRNFDQQDALNELISSQIKAQHAAQMSRHSTGRRQY